MSDVTITFREKTLTNLANFLATNKDFADLHAVLQKKIEAAEVLAAPETAIPVTLSSEKAEALFELISKTLKSLTAVPQQSDVWNLLAFVLKK